MFLESSLWIPCLRYLTWFLAGSIVLVKIVGGRVPCWMNTGKAKKQKNFVEYLPLKDLDRRYCSEKTHALTGLHRKRALPWVSLKGLSVKLIGNRRRRKAEGLWDSTAAQVPNLIKGLDGVEKTLRAILFPHKAEREVVYKAMAPLNDDFSRCLFALKHERA